MAIQGYGTVKSAATQGQEQQKKCHTGITEAPEPSTIPQYKREGQGALGFSQRRLRRKTKGGIAALGAAKSHVGFPGALPGPKGGNPTICYRVKKIYSRVVPGDKSWPSIKLTYVVYLGPRHNACHYCCIMIGTISVPNLIVCVGKVLT